MQEQVDNQQQQKPIGQNFCAVIWVGKEETDVPRLYYYYHHDRNRTNDNAQEIMIKTAKLLVGLMGISQTFAGPSLKYSFPTQTFDSQKQISVVRDVFPYRIVLSVLKPCSESAIIHLLNFITQVMFMNANHEKYVQFAPVSKKMLIPDTPCPGFDEEVAPMLDGLLSRFFQDQCCREFLLNSLHPILLPKDIITPHLFILQQFKQLQQLHPNATFCALKNGRVLLSTAGAFMTNFVTLLINTNQEIYNRRIHYIFSNYLTNQQNFSCFQENTENDNQCFKNFSVIYVSCFQLNGMSFVLVDQQPTQLKQNYFNVQLQQLNDKLQQQGNTPPILTHQKDQIYPTFAPIPGAVDICGVDSAKFFKALRGVQNLQTTDQQVDYGCGALDAGLICFCLERNCEEILIVTQQEELDINRQFQKQGNFYNYAENQINVAGLLTGNRRQKPLLMTIFRQDKEGIVKTYGSSYINENDDWRKVQKIIQEYIEVYLRVRQI